MLRISHVYLKQYLNVQNLDDAFKEWQKSKPLFLRVRYVNAAPFASTVVAKEDKLKTFREQFSNTGNYMPLQNLHRQGIDPSASRVLVRFSISRCEFDCLVMLIAVLSRLTFLQLVSQTKF